MMFEDMADANLEVLIVLLLQNMLAMENKTILGIQMVTAFREKTGIMDMMMMEMA